MAAPIIWRKIRKRRRRAGTARLLLPFPGLALKAVLSLADGDEEVLRLVVEDHGYVAFLSLGQHLDAVFAGGFGVALGSADKVRIQPDLGRRQIRAEERRAVAGLYPGDLMPLRVPTPDLDS